MARYSESQRRTRIAFDYASCAEMARRTELLTLEAYASAEDLRERRRAITDRADGQLAVHYLATFHPLRTLCGPGELMDTTSIHVDLLANQNYPFSAPASWVMGRMPWSPHFKAGTVICIGDLWDVRGRTLLAHLIRHHARLLNWDHAARGGGYIGWNAEAIAWYRSNVGDRPLTPDLDYPELPADLVYGIDPGQGRRRARRRRRPRATAAPLGAGAPAARPAPGDRAPATGTFRPHGRTKGALLVQPRPRRGSAYVVYGDELGAPEVHLHVRVLEDLRRATLDAVPDETIGALLGRPCRDDFGTYVVVENAIAAEPGEHAGGHGDVRIPADGRAAMQRRGAQRHPALEPVGWWHSHPRGRPRFSAVDREEQATYSREHHVGIVVAAEHLDDRSAVSGRPRDALGVYVGPASTLLARRSDEHDAAPIERGSATVSPLDEALLEDEPHPAAPAPGTQRQRAAVLVVAAVVLVPGAARALRSSAPGPVTSGPVAWSALGLAVLVAGLLVRRGRSPRGRLDACPPVFRGRSQTNAPCWICGRPPSPDCGHCRQRP